MIPDNMLEELSPARSYGLLESCGLDRSTLPGDEQSDYFADCEEYFPGFHLDGNGGESKTRRIS